jgi:hypothetical protein
MESARQTEPPGQGPAADLWHGVHPVVRKGYAAFDRELPRLLEERRGQWVAYHGEERIGFHADDLALYEECERRGIPEEEVLVVRIEPVGELLFAGPR